MIREGFWGFNPDLRANVVNNSARADPWVFRSFSDNSSMQTWGCFGA